MQSPRVAGHLEDSHDPEYSQRLSHSLDGVELVDKGGEVVWKNGKEVNDVHGSFYKSETRNDKDHSARRIIYDLTGFFEALPQI